MTTPITDDDARFIAARRTIRRIESVRRLDELGVVRAPRPGYMIYEIPAIGTASPLVLALPRDADWSVLHAVLDDAERQSKEAP